MDAFILSKGNIEFSTPVEAAQPVISRSVKIIKELCGRFALLAFRVYECIESLAVGVIQQWFIAHRKPAVKPALEPLVEIDEVGIDVIQQRARRPEPKSNG